jgi:hypothetical protein
VNESTSYTLEWQWPYETETDSDANDTLLGNSANTEFTLKLIIAAEADEPVVTPPEGSETEQTTETENTESTEPEDTEIGEKDIGQKDKDRPDDGTGNNGTPGDTENNGGTTPGGSGSSHITNRNHTDQNTGNDTSGDNGSGTNDTDDGTGDSTEVLNQDFDTFDESNDTETGVRFPWIWVPGLLFLFWFIIILWRRITITGYLQDENGEFMEGYVLRLEQSGLHKTKKAEVDEDGWFKIRRIPLGKKTLILEDEDGNEIAQNRLRLKRKGKLRIDDFLQIEEKKEDDEEKIYTEIDMRYRITGFEIYLHQSSADTRMEIEKDRWLAHTWFNIEYEPEEDEDNGDEPEA